MKTTQRMVVAVAATSLLSVTPARAALFTIEGGRLDPTPAQTSDWRGNDWFGVQDGYVGAQLMFRGEEGQPYLFTFEFVFREAAWLSTLQTAGGSITNNSIGGTTVAFSLVAAQTDVPQLVPFSFLVHPVPADPPLNDATVSNGTNPDPQTPPQPRPPIVPNIFFSIATADLSGGTAGRLGTVAWIGLDDCGAGPDDDYDDWLGLVRITPIPEPTSITLLGGGLVAAMARLRRRSRIRTASGRRELEGRQTRA